MPLPRTPEARPYYRAAKKRFEDAEFLLEAERTTAAVYLAGYGVECILKALILSATPREKRGDILGSFHGAWAHDFDWLKKQYKNAGGAPFPGGTARDFALVDTWTTDLRYRAADVKWTEAETFLTAAREIVTWADRRM